MRLCLMTASRSVLLNLSKPTAHKACRGYQGLPAALPPRYDEPVGAFVAAGLVAPGWLPPRGNRVAAPGCFSFAATVRMIHRVHRYAAHRGAFAQPAPGPGTTREPTVTRPATPGLVTPSTINEVYASKLIGASVKSTQGVNLGKIDELVIDPHDARIKAAVVSVGGVLVLGAKSVAIPWDRMTMGTGADRDTIIVAMGKDELERAPGWQKSER